MDMHTTMDMMDSTMDMGMDSTMDMHTTMDMMYSTMDMGMDSTMDMMYSTMRAEAEIAAVRNNPITFNLFEFIAIVTLSMGSYFAFRMCCRKKAVDAYSPLLEESEI